jgi:dolichyl-phosphate-mannose-protein mannosyltransferase
VSGDDRPVAPAAPGVVRRAREWALVAGVFAVVLGVAIVWLSIDRHPPEWDHANHLEHAVNCARDLAAGDLRATLGHSSFYPPLVPCAAGLVFPWWPSDVAFGEVVILGFLGAGIAATYVLGRRFAGGPGGVVAATLFATAPFTVNQALRFQLEVPLAAMVALFLLALLATDRFAHRGWAIVTGILFGLGMLTKPPFCVYVGPACLLVLCGVRGRSAWRHASVAGVVAALVALPWYGPRLFGLPQQLQNRSFKQAVEAGFPEPLSAASLAYYPLNSPRAFGVVAVLLLVLGLGVALRRRQWFVLAGLAPLLVFLALQNKQARYLLPLFPMAGVAAGVGYAALPRPLRRASVVALALVAALQVSSTAFARPAHVGLAGRPLTDPAPPLGADWQHRRILDLIERDSGGAAATVSITANHSQFSPSNFRYYVVRDRRPLRIGRAWDGEPVGVEYMVSKTGDVGPPWTVDKSRRIAERLAADPALARAFPVIGEFALPDGSSATVRARRTQPGPATTPDALARAIEGGLRARLQEVTRDVDGLGIRLEYDAAILAGRIRRLEISVAAATIGELRRRAPALLRVHDLRLVVDDALVNPWSAAADGRFDPLDAGRLTVARATIDAADLQRFLGQVKGLGRTSLVLGAGYADVRFALLGPDVSARVRFGAAVDRPVAVVAERVWIGSLPVPSMLANWVIRNFDPSRGIASRLPFPAVVAPVTVTPAAVRVGG